MAVGRRAAADHRAVAARQREQPARVRRGGSPTTASRGSASAPASATQELPEALVDEADKRDFRCSRCPTRHAVHRDHREGLRAAGQRAVRGAAAGDRRARAGWSGSSSRSAASRKSRRRSPTRSAARCRSSTAAATACRPRLSAASFSADAIAGIRKEALGHSGDGHRLRPLAPFGGRGARSPIPYLARRRATAGLGGDRPRLGRARRLRAADPAAGGARWWRWS